ncbi:MAG: glycosyltransferase [Zestosphaera sp.]
MRVSVVVVSYCRSWALKSCLESLSRQSRPIDEVVVVLKSCGDGSEEVVRAYEKLLPVKLIHQSYGNNCADAYELGYRNATGDLILFIDDDAIADESWVFEYEKFFNAYPNAGAAGGLVLKAYLDENRNLIKTNELFYQTERVALGPHRVPLKGLEDYCEWISSAGFMGSRECRDRELSLGLPGVNMAFRAKLIRDFPLTLLYGKSRKCFWFEKVLAYYLVRKGYKVYLLSERGQAPKVWHIAHEESLTRSRGFWGEFWLHYDRVMMFWRLRKLGATLSPLRYLFGLVVLLRKNTVPRLVATIYGLCEGILIS